MKDHIISLLGGISRLNIEALNEENKNFTNILEKLKIENKNISTKLKEQNLEIEEITKK